MPHHDLDPDDPWCDSRTAYPGEPVPVRVVRGDPYAGPDGEIRLAFDAWVLRALIVLYVVGSIVT
jgi:hypothetical protein